MKTTLPEAIPGARPVHLPALVAFECVARHMNFARAAAELEVTPTAMSKTIKQLEAQLGVRLFNRTTRSVALTESGNQLLDTLAPALEQIRFSVQQVHDTATRPYGELKINSSYVAYASLIEPHVPAFLALYPDITLDISLDNGLSDIIGEGFDAGVRLGQALQRDMIAVPLGTSQPMVVVGTPQYLAQSAPLNTPEDLLKHECIRQRLSRRGPFMDWSFRIGKANVEIEVKGRLVLDEMRTTLSAAQLGCGLAMVFRPFAAKEIASGQLVALLEKYAAPAETFHLYYANRAQMPGKLRAFIDFFQARNRQATE
ncbi:LysR family transcriptional regulator [Pseudomonas tolaasii]|uniref:LysR family transcriptional regulator n=2 Tax=Pseudomonas tolaasii TaxID=29442 RepID=A0A7Y8DSF4_PSETO|nr:LysR family transcriptional regulator [Pseudomonas tolaasii]KAB0466995.1 LysR family transcriptional regulator [Pseudomonas tolaasii]MBY8939158.1 LysR family transcriptional regulator [Pseudomonas tolaasii]NWC18816.1 LysR family transcriptional regulator [Pseudomonas tolaasii]NWC42355.1 LysR family transcriptional regulator [Pseudomonas tolaasii]